MRSRLRRFIKAPSTIYQRGRDIPNFLGWSVFHFYHTSHVYHDIVLKTHARYAAFAKVYVITISIQSLSLCWLGFARWLPLSFLVLPLITSLVLVIVTSFLTAEEPLSTLAHSGNHVPSGTPWSLVTLTLAPLGSPAPLWRPLTPRAACCCTRSLTV